MTTIIRRSPRRRRGPVVAKVAVMLGGLVLAGVLALAWLRGGPQPVREIALALPVPDSTPNSSGAATSHGAGQ